jgi:hypothetical protein
MFADSTTLSDKAKEVAEVLGCDWHSVAVTVELCAEYNVPVEIYGREIRRDDSLEPLEQRLKILEEMAW